MRTEVSTPSPTYKRAWRMQASVHVAPRGFDVVDEHTNTHMMHLRATGRQRRVARRRLCTRLREAEAHLLSCRPLRCAPARWASDKAMRIRLRRQFASKHASGDRSMHWGDTHASKSPSIFPLSPTRGRGLTASRPQNQAAVSLRRAAYGKVGFGS